MKKIGFISEDECIPEFNNFKGYFVNPDNPNYPKDKNSPNYPRKAGRVFGFQNPLLGDPGWGEIARWQKVRTSALQTLVDQMIEQFTRDRTWYSATRCRESLWNMYRRLEWWVNQNIEPNDPNYQNALSFIRDCIVQILDTGERPEIIYSHNFKEGLDNSFIYTGDWGIDDYGYLSGVYIFGETVEINEEDEEYEEWCIEKTVEYANDGLITFNYALVDDVEKFVLETDGNIIWNHSSTELVDHTEFTFKDITLPVPKGVHEFKWKLIGDIGGSTVKIEEIVFIELFPETKKPDEIPWCPLPYMHHYSSDYMNYFSGVPYERPTFSTVGGAKVSDYLDMIRYVSSKENIEWEQIKYLDSPDYEEIIFKLPLERLPETLSSKMTFNWRMKRKGYVIFKYWVDGGNGSNLLFYINNQLVGGPWKDTDGWQIAKFNVSLPQTYKFDILVYKEFSSDLGTNAVYIKDIEVVEVTDYEDKPMPEDYTYKGEEAEVKYGKWLIYSHRNALGTYYRGFPDGVLDREREIELEFYSECDGVFGFGYKLGTEKPDRFYVDGLVFSEQHDLNEKTIVWNGSENGVEVSTITFTNKYISWNNNFIEGFDGRVLWTKDNSNIKYNMKIDGEWNRGEKILRGFGKIGVFSPPKYLIDEGYVLSSKVGTWYTSGAWESVSGGVRMEAFEGDEYRSATYYTGSENVSYIDVEVSEWLDVNEGLDIYLNDQLYFSSLSGFKNLKLKVPATYGSNLRFEVNRHDVWEDEGEDEINLVFTGFFEFDGPYDSIRGGRMYEVINDNLGVTRFYGDGRGRELELLLRKGGLDSKNSWYTNTGFKIITTLLPKDELIIDLSTIKFPYVSIEYMEELVNEYIEDKDPIEPIRIFYEIFNPYENEDKFTYGSEWMYMEVYDFIGLDNAGDSVLACYGNGMDNIVDVDLSDVVSERNKTLNFEYGALFEMGDRLDVFAETGNGYVIVGSFNKSCLNADGITLKNIVLPKETTGLRFVYCS